MCVPHSTTFYRSFLAYIVIYLVAGVPLIARWGGDLPEPVTNVFSNSFAGVLVKLVLVAGTLLDFVLASTTVNRFVMRHVKPEFDYTWTLANAKTWATCSIPSSVLAVIMALFLPKLESLTGLLNSVAGATLQITAVPLALVLTDNEDVIPMLPQPKFIRNSALIPDEVIGGYACFVCTKYGTYGNALGCRFCTAASYGLVFTLVVFIAACYDIGETNYMPVGNETFWCDVVG